MFRRLRSSAGLGTRLLKLSLRALGRSETCHVLGEIAVEPRNHRLGRGDRSARCVGERGALLPLGHGLEIGRCLWGVNDCVAFGGA